jgi:hypothetical protein
VTFPDQSVEAILGALDHYATALGRVAHDFAARGASLTPARVRLAELDAIVVDYGRPGRAEVSTIGALPVVSSVELAVVELADLLQEKVLESGDVLWPGCLPGHSHPPAPRLSSGTAVWACPKESIAVGPIG